MRRFKPNNLRERVAEMLAHQRGWESAMMIRRQLPDADALIELILGHYVTDGDLKIMGSDAIEISIVGIPTKQPLERSGQD